MVVQIIKLRSSLSEEALLNKAKERESSFKAIPGLMQKYYCKLKQPNQYAGVYIWESQESLKKYSESDLVTSIPEAYQLVEAPNIEIMDVLFKLRE